MTSKNSQGPKDIQIDAVQFGPFAEEKKQHFDENLYLCCGALDTKPPIARRNTNNIISRQQPYMYWKTKMLNYSRDYAARAFCFIDKPTSLTFFLIFSLFHYTFIFRP